MTAGGLIVVTAWAVGRLGLIGERSSITEILPQAIAVLLVVLAWRYRRDRLAVAAALVSAVHVLLKSVRLEEPTGVGVLALFTAVDLLLLAVTRDRPLRRLTGLVWIAVLGLQCWTVVFGVRLAGLRVPPWLAHPSLAPTAMLIAAAVTLAVFIIRRGAFEAALIWTGVAGAAALATRQETTTSSLFCLAAALTLLVGVFEDSYRLAFHDELTGLPGRRALQEAIQDLTGAFTIAMADIDHFKRFNDRHGHDAGDQVLRMVADELARVGGNGRAYRYGGEEFTIVFPGKTISEVRPALEELRSAIADRKFSLRGPDRPKKRPDKLKRSARQIKKVTVALSFGFAGTDSRRTTADAVIRAADRALYRAKKAGRNRVVAAGDRLKP